MLRSVVKKVMWVGRATVFLVGFAVILALMFGVVSRVSAHTGDKGFFHLGHSNSATTPTSLVSRLADAAKSALVVNNKSGGPALDLRVGNASTPANEVAPMKVNSEKVVANLNADKLDGKDSTQLGVNGRHVVGSFSAFNSNSPKSATASCPSGKILVGTGYIISGGKRGTSPNTETDVAVTSVFPAFAAVSVDAYEEEPTNASWYVGAYAICANRP